jgi:hypothetical protein
MGVSLSVVDFSVVDVVIKAFDDLPLVKMDGLCQLPQRTAVARLGVLPALPHTDGGNRCGNCGD